MFVKPFNEFLIDILLDWLEPRISIGYRYQYRSSNPDNTLSLIDELNKRLTSSVSFGDFSLPFVEVNGVKLIVAIHQDIYNPDVEMDSEEVRYRYTENYISMLRDFVGKQPPLENCALLVIHNSLLDTLLTSAENLADFIWSPQEIQQKLKRIVYEQEPSRRVTFECLLEYQANIIKEDEESMFGFQHLFTAIHSGDLCLKELHLFNDLGILSLTNKSQIQRRLDENRQLKEKIEFAVEHYPDDLENRLNDFGSSFIDKHFGLTPDNPWKDLDFKVFQEEIAHQTKQVLEFVNISSDDSLLRWREKSETKAGKRDIQVIVEVPDQSRFNIIIEFIGGKLFEKEVSIRKNTLEKKIDRSGGKRNRLILSGETPEHPRFFTIQINRDNAAEKYSFKVLVVKKDIFYLDPIITCFQINSNKKKILLQTDEQELTINPIQQERITLVDSAQSINYYECGVLDYRKLYDESDLVTFSVFKDLSKLEFEIEGAVNRETLVLPLLFDQGRFNLLFDDNYYGQFRPDKGMVIIDNAETELVAIRKKLLEYEYEFISKQLIFLNDESDEFVTIIKLQEINGNLYDSFKNLLLYFQKQRTSPSLSSWGSELVGLVKIFLTQYLAYLKSIPQGHNLNDQQRLIMELGMAYCDGKEFFTPFHPIILSYYLNVVQKINDDTEFRSFKDLSTLTCRKLNAKGLVPYVYSQKYKFAYTQVVEENPFWLEVVPNVDTNYGFVSKLVFEKTQEFISTFRDLFNHVEDALLIINSVNNGKNIQLFKGLVKFYREQLGKSLNIHINLYDDSVFETEFDEFAELADYDDIKNRYALDKGAAAKHADLIVDLLRTKLSFSKFTNAEASQKGQAYSHLTFFKNNQEITAADHQIEKHLTGIASGGLLNGESSRYENGHYFTGLGMSGIDLADKPHLEIAKLVNTLLQPARNPNVSYHSHSAISLRVSENFQVHLQRSYQSSIWTTIIDPKVTLEFFQNQQDVVLIHYSDQYTNSASYDAITVTPQAGIYEAVLGYQGQHLVKEFNSFNGDWLLKLVTDNETEKKAKRGIIGAYKFIANLLSDSQIIWLPVSMAEMIRVSGNVGLSMSDSDFSRLNREIRKGMISDDILFVGFKDEKLFLLPVEVKTGHRPDFSKARKQVIELRRFLVEDILGGASLAANIFKGLFIRQMLMQVEKYELYEVFDPDYFKPLFENRAFWLSGEYKLGNLPNYPSAMVVAHIEDQHCFQPKYTIVQEVLEIELPEGYLDTLVNNSRKQLYPLIVEQNILQIPINYFLTNQNNQNELLVIEDNQPETVDDNDFLESQDGNLLDQSNAVDDFENIDSHPYTQEEITEPLVINFGVSTLDKKTIYWEPTNTEKVFNTNTGIIGTMGTGKTQFTKSLIAQMVENQDKNVGDEPLGILIFDYKADYIKEDFVNATNAKVFNLHKLPFNPFALFGNKQMLPLHTANLFRATLGTAYGLGNKQQNKIRTLVIDAYENAGILPSNSSTWSNLPPTLQNVWDLFQEQEKVEHDSLYAALDDLVSFEIFESDSQKTQSLYDLVNGVVVINLSGYDEKVQNLVVAITLDIFYSQMHQQGSSKLIGKYRQISKMILVDEADNFMSQDFGSLKKILKEGREFGVGTILSTQELTHFRTGENDYSSYILTWIIHRVAAIKTQDIKSIFNTSSKQDEEYLMSQIRELDKHYSLYIDGEKKMQKIRDLAFWELNNKD